MAKKYSVSVEDGEVVSVEVDGRVYTDPEDVPDPEDREKIRSMVDQALESDLDEDFDEDFEQEMNMEISAGSSLDPARIVFFVFLGVGLLLVLIASISSYFAVQRMAREESTPGTVVEMVRRNSGEGDVLYYPVIAYRVPGGDLQMVELSVGTWPPAYEVGQLVTVAYDPQNPSQARIQSLGGSFDLWIHPLITGFLGIIFLVVTYFVRRFGMESAT